MFSSIRIPPHLRIFGLAVSTALPARALQIHFGLSVCVFPCSGYRRQEVEGRHPEEHGDRSGGGDAQSDRPSGQPRIHRGQHEQLWLRREVSKTNTAQPKFIHC